MNLRRRMPLVASTRGLRRKPQRDPVSASERDFVLRRDGHCLMADVWPAHVCRDRWGVPHGSHVVPLLTAEHVKDELAMGLRAPSDRRHMVALCWGANVAVPSKEARAYFREYLAKVNAVPHG